MCEDYTSHYSDVFPMKEKDLSQEGTIYSLCIKRLVQTVWIISCGYFRVERSNEMWCYVVCGILASLKVRTIKENQWYISHSLFQSGRRLNLTLSLLPSRLGRNFQCLPLWKKDVNTPPRVGMNKKMSNTSLHSVVYNYTTVERMFTSTFRNFIHFDTRS